MATGDTIKFVKIGNTEHPIDATKFNGQDATYYQSKGNLVDSISSSSTDDEYPSAKCMWNIVGDIERRLSNI